MNYFFFVAEEVREYMAQMGIRSFDELIGRSDLLDMKHGIAHWKAKGWISPSISSAHVAASVARYHAQKQDHGWRKRWIIKLIAQAQSALEQQAGRGYQQRD